VAGERLSPEVLATVRDPTGSPVIMYWATTLFRTQISRSARSSIRLRAQFSNLKVNQDSGICQEI